MQILVFTDFVLAVLLTVLIPLLFLVFYRNSRATLFRLLAYWRVSSLLMIAVYLLMAEQPAGLLSGVVARILIPLVIWFGDGLLGDRHGRISTGKFFIAWKQVITIYCLLGLIITLPVVHCFISGDISEYCQMWYDAPKVYGNLLHREQNWGQLAHYAQAALWIYGLYFCASVLMKLLHYQKSTTG